MTFISATMKFSPKFDSNKYHLVPVYKDGNKNEITGFAVIDRHGNLVVTMDGVSSIDELIEKYIYDNKR